MGRNSLRITSPRKYITINTLVVINSVHIRFKFVSHSLWFVSNLLEACFKFASNACQMRYKFASNSFNIKFTSDFAVVVSSYGQYKEKMRHQVIAASEISALFLRQACYEKTSIFFRNSNQGSFISTYVKLCKKLTFLVP